jgi:hypothetical protein
MNPLSEFENEYIDLDVQIKDLQIKKNDVLYKYIKEKSNASIESTIANIGKYLHEANYVHYEHFLEECKKHLTMCPISDSVRRETKYGSKVNYDSILYEWDGRRIMYVRADPNSDCYYSGCDEFNTFSNDVISSCYPIIFQYNFWDTEGAVDFDLQQSIEEIIISNKKNKKIKKNFKTLTSSLPIEFCLIIAAFDLSYCNYHCCIGEEKITNIVHFIPDVRL